MASSTINTANYIMTYRVLFNHTSSRLEKDYFLRRASDLLYSTDVAGHFDFLKAYEEDIKRRKAKRLENAFKDLM